MTAILIAVVVVILLVGLVTVLHHERRHESLDLDTERTEQWFVRHSPAPLQRILRSVDRRFAGGASLVVAFVVILGSAIGVGWVLDGADESRGFARWDDSAAEFGAENMTEGSTRVLEVVTQLGGTGWLLAVMGVTGVASWVMHRRPAALGYLAAVGLGVSALNNALKHLVERERPAVLQLTSSGGFSFPSGHTAAAAACWAAILLVLVRRRRRSVRAAAAVAAMTVTAAVAASRVLLGVHWLSDVIAGAVVGWAWFVLVTVLFGGRLLRFGEPMERIAESPDVTDAAGDGDRDSPDRPRSPSPRRSSSNETADAGGGGAGRR